MYCETCHIIQLETVGSEILDRYKIVMPIGIILYLVDYSYI